MDVTISYHTVDGEITSVATQPYTRSVAMLTDALGSVVRTEYPFGGADFRYSAYGKLLKQPAGWNTPYIGWVGSLGYRETNLSHAEQYIRARHYSSTEARWTTKDRLWPRERPLCYGRNNPATNIDPSGTTCVTTITQLEKHSWMSVRNCNHSYYISWDVPYPCLKCSYSCDPYPHLICIPAICHHRFSHRCDVTDITTEYHISKDAEGDLRNLCNLFGFAGGAALCFSDGWGPLCGLIGLGACDILGQSCLQPDGSQCFRFRDYFNTCGVCPVSS